MSYEQQTAHSHSRPRPGTVLLALVMAWISLAPGWADWHWLGGPPWWRVCILLAAGLGVLALRPEVRAAWMDRADWPLAFFLLCASPGMLAVVNPRFAGEFYRPFIVLAPCLYFMGKAAACDESARRQTAMVMATAGGLMALYALLEVALGSNPIYEFVTENPCLAGCVRSARPVGTQYNPAPLSTYLLAVLPFAWVVFRREKAGWLRAVGLAATAAVVAALLFTRVRSSFVGLVGGAFLYLLLQRRYRLFAVLAVAFLAAFALASFLPKPWSRLSLMGIAIRGHGFFSVYRLTRLQMAWEMMRTKPLFGVGWMQYRVLFNDFYPRGAELARMPLAATIADNMHATLLAETGVLGVISFYLLMGRLTLRALRARGLTSDPARQGWLAATVCGLAAVLASMAGYEMFHWTGPFSAFWLLCGLIAGAAGERDRGST